MEETSESVPTQSNTPGEKLDSGPATVSHDKVDSVTNANDTKRLPEKPTPRLPSAFWKEWIDFYSKILQIVAILVGAGWVIWVFALTVLPGLEPKVNPSGDITWTAGPSKTQCEARFTVSVKNPGPNAVRIESADFSLWLFKLHDLKPSATSKPFIVGSTNFTGEDGQTPALISHETIEQLTEDLAVQYPPGSENGSSFPLIFDRTDQTYVYMKVSLTGHGYKFPFIRSTVENYGYAIDRICGDIDAKQKQQP